MESDYNNSLSMDIQNLISCIHWHEGSNNDHVVIETLKTITDLCTNNEFGRDVLRNESGLDFLVEFMFTTDNAVYLEHSLKTLACVVDGNIHNQMYMTKKSVFEVIQTILRNCKFPVITRKNAIVLVSAILYQNSTAQSSICEVGLLQDLLNIYEQGAERFLSGSSYAPTSDDPLNELWITSISSLCFAVNNPKHETNQVLCSTIFQISLRILEFSTNAEVIGSVSSLLSLCISNNRYCQDKFAQNDGLLACKRFFQKHFNLVLADIKDCNNIIRKEALTILSSITGVISAAVLEHESNADFLGRLGLVSLLVELFFVKVLDINLKTKIVLSLGHSIDACSKNKGHVIGVNNFDNLLKDNLCLQNHELSSACKYLLQVCLMQEEFDQEENIQNADSPLEENIASKGCNYESSCKITILNATLPGKESEISDDSSDTSSSYYPAEVLLEKLKSEGESSDSQLTENIPLAKAKSAQGGKLPNVAFAWSKFLRQIAKLKQRI
ncbi:hypothetical protein JTE90_025339 [Oedothorax gibbosus]|uniref:Uncharacterized protein n=1 Tax=Oedothorax gibbosus TaxID=931172 RepID=A0AAV6V8Z2_9ARAC|nr:hypothetical protein JTE90_025339 [Oedothorax gibbosus]